VTTTSDVPYPMSESEWNHALELRIKTLSLMLQEVAFSGVELNDARMSYVIVQINKDLWQNICVFKEYKPKIN